MKGHRASLTPPLDTPNFRLSEHDRKKLDSYRKRPNTPGSGDSQVFGGVLKIQKEEGEKTSEMVCALVGSAGVLFNPGKVVV